MCFRKIRTINGSWMELPQDNIVTCTPIARQRVNKQVPEKTDSW
jgi:hypothetical protein